MADVNSDSHPISPTSKDSVQNVPVMAEPESKVDSSEEQTNKEKEEDDNKGAYTAATRGFPPSRFTPRAGAFGGGAHFGSNPFAARSCLSKSSLDGGQSSESGSSLWPGLTPSKLGGAVGGSGPSSPVISRPVLRPAQLSSPVATPPTDSAPRTSFPLNPPRLGNPFVTKVSEGEESKTTKAEEPSSEAPSNQTPVRFVPLSHASTAQESTSAALPSTPASFVFGQNLHERVEGSPNHVAQTPSTSKQAENGTSEAGSSTTPTTNGTSAEMLFSAGLKEQGPETSSENSSLAGSSSEPAKSLSEAAREYEESRSAVKRKYEQVAVLTGEEDETNVLQVTAKLFAYDKGAGAWKERGHGQLRLNDKVGSSSSGLQSRIIMRNFGSFRVVLNTKVWASMVVDRASTVSLRITAMDNDKVKVFLIKTSAKEAESLHTALERRVASQRQRAEAAPSSPNSQGEVEEARRGVETLPPAEAPCTKKGRSSDAADSLSSSDNETPDLEL